jgi:hypothetical protein
MCRYLTAAGVLDQTAQPAWSCGAIVADRLLTVSMGHSKLSPVALLMHLWDEVCCAHHSTSAILSCLQAVALYI